MRIYYFGELIEDTNKKEQIIEIEQTALDLQSLDKPKKVGMDSIGDLLNELNLNLDVYRPFSLQNQKENYA